MRAADDERMINYQWPNVKSSTYYFHMKTKTLPNFQICISKKEPIAGVSVNLPNCFRTVFLQNTCERLPLCFSVLWKNTMIVSCNSNFLVSSIHIYQKIFSCLLVRLRTV